MSLSPIVIIVLMVLSIFVVTYWLIKYSVVLKTKIEQAPVVPGENVTVVTTIVEEKHNV